MEDSGELRLVESLSSLKALARALSRDEAEADDLVQESALIALTREPTQSNTAGWLRGVLRNTWRMNRRTDARRAAREHTAATPEIHEPNERVHLYSQLCRLVSELPEAFREVVILRYVDELNSAEIGATLGIAPSTARVRLKRALALLRVGLEPSERRSAVPMALIGKGLFVKTSTKLSIVAIVALLVAVVALGIRWTARQGSESDATQAEATDSTKNEIAEQPERPLAKQLGSARGRDSPPPSAGDSSWEVQVNVPETAVAGRVVWNGKGVRNARVELQTLRAAADRESSLITRTRDGGEFRFDGVAAANHFVVATYPDAAGASLAINLAEPAAREQAKSLVLKLHDCSTRIVGNAPEGRQSTIILVQQHRFFGPSVDADRDGSFVICVRAGLEAAKLRFVDSDGPPQVRTIELSEGLPATRVEFASRAGTRVFGRVLLDETGEPAGSVQLNLWGRAGAPSLSTWADEAGNFAFASVGPGAYAFNAWGPDQLSLESNEVVVEHVGDAVEIDIAVTQTTRISGTVVDGQSPVSGARIQAGDSFASTTQEDGSFTLRGVRDGRNEITVEDYTVLESGDVDVPFAGLVDIVLRVQPESGD